MSDIPLGTPIAGRANSALEALVGFFVNTLVLRTDLRGDPSFAQLLARVREADLVAFEHDALPFDRLVEALNPPRVRGRNPLFQVMLSYQDRSEEPAALLGLEGEMRLAPNGAAMFDLDFIVVESDALTIELQYTTDRFDVETAQALTERLERLLAQVVAEPQRPVGAIDVLLEEERRLGAGRVRRRPAAGGHGDAHRPARRAGAAHARRTRVRRRRRRRTANAGSNRGGAWMKLVLFGYQTWGHRLLEALLDSRHEVVLVVTHPPGDDAYTTIWSDSVQELAEQHAVPVLVKNQPDEEAVRRVREADADVLVACSWRTWIPPEIFKAPRLGTLNVHDSLLPKYAGFAPLVWALINGETEVGITAHVMDDELDRGDIILQERVAVAPTDTTADLFHKTIVAVRAGHARRAGAHGARHRRAHPAGPLAGELLPQALRRGQPDRLDLARAGHRQPRPRPGRSRIPTRTRSTTASACASSRPRCRARAAAAPPGGSSPARATASSSSAARSRIAAPITASS